MAPSNPKSAIYLLVAFRVDGVHCAFSPCPWVTGITLAYHISDIAKYNTLNYGTVSLTYMASLLIRVKIGFGKYP